MDVATTTRSTKVFLLDDHPPIRSALRQMLESEGDFLVTGEAGSGIETLEKIADSDADLAFVDISMEGMNGIELTRRLKESAPDLNVLIVSMHGETRYVEDALEAGASGYVLKANVHNVLLEAARTVANGGVYLCDELEDKL